FGTLRDTLAARTAERERAERALGVSMAETQKLALLANLTHNAVIITDPELRIEWVNESFTRMTGYVLEEVRGETPGTFLGGPGTDLGTVHLMRAAVSREQPFTAEILNYRKDGRPYWNAIEAQPLKDEDGRLTGYMTIETDVTERHRTQSIE